MMGRIRLNILIIISFILIYNIGMEEHQVGHLVFAFVGLIVIGGGIKNIITGQFNLGRSQSISRDSGNKFWFVTLLIIVIGVFFVYQGLMNYLS